MKTILFFLSIVTCFSPIYANPKHRKRNSHQKALVKNNQFYQKNHVKLKQSPMPLQKKDPAPGTCFSPYKDLFPEIQNIIIDYATSNSSAITVIEATRTINNLLFTNKHFAALISKPDFSDNLINNFATKYKCSHETIARKLITAQSKKRLELQNKLKDLCCREEEDDDLEETLTSLIEQGVNLDFTYNYNGSQKNPLMISMNYDNNAFKFLLEHGANINGTNSLGTSVLQMSLADPALIAYAMQLITHKNIALEQKNNHGETILLYCLTTKRIRSNPLFKGIIMQLIKHGANAQNPNKKKLTPLAAAEKLCSNAILKIIKRSIKA